jgi:predicted acylesterase/phospholipase RssA
VRVKTGHKPPSLETIGAANHNLIAPCRQSQPLARDPAREDRSHIDLAFSGGGWRAALAAAGVLRFVCETGLLPVCAGFPRFQAARF